MRKFFVVVLVVALGVFVAKQFSVPQLDLISPLSKKDELSFLQRLIDSKVFEKNKEKVAASPVDWAMGNGRPDPLVSNSSSYVVVDGDGNIVLAKDPDTKKSPASLTKLMTAMVALDLSREDEVFTVPKESVNLEPTILMVDEGESFSRQELLQGTLVTSANDAADVLARGVAKKLGGSVEVFIKLMNQKAQNLGLTNTVFANPTGYDDPRQTSTPRELARLSQYALENYPTIRELVGTRSARLDKTGTHKSFELPNWNALLGVYPGVDGVKIGYTEGAGYVTIVTAERDEKRFMVVLLGAPDRRARDFWATQLLNSAFSESGIKPFRVTLPMLKLREAEWGKQLLRAQEAQGE